MNMEETMMAENSRIEWCDHSWNPWIGCTKVSPGRKNCYAETWAKRYPNIWANTWGPQGTRIKTSDANWKKPLSWNRKAEQEGRRYKVFCGSLCDVFENRPELDDWRTNLFELIAQTPALDWLLLTKRPEDVAFIVAQATCGVVDLDDLGNVWIGTSVENQEQADKRIPELLKIPARVRFLSVEPMLEPVDLTLALGGEDGTGLGGYGIRSAVDWVIVGGESGPNRRPFNPDWARHIRDQCQRAGVPFFMKQVDKARPIPPDLMIREFPE